MKKILLSLAVLFSFLSTASAQFPPLPAADLVLGATDFDTAGDGLPTATGLDEPGGIAIDPTSGAVFVADSGHNRVLRYPNFDALSNGAAAVVAFGQPGLTQSNPGLSATTLSYPTGLYVDAAGRLWVADTGNQRILMFEDASNRSSGAVADLVLGQSDFDTADVGNSASRMNVPAHAFVDANDNLWVTDVENNRVLKFVGASTLSNGAAATIVLGHPDFFLSNTLSVTASSMENPSAVMVDDFDNLWVADRGNDRILRFSNASLAASGASADGVLGQPDFVSEDSGSSDRAVNTPNSVLIDPAGTLWVTDDSTHKILLFKNARLKPNGAPVDDLIGQADFATETPGLSARRMNGPVGGALDLSGRLWVCDSANDRVLRFTPDEVRPVVTVKKLPRKITKAKLKIRGNARDASGIAAVRYRSKGAFRLARGAAAWNFTTKLKPGRNKFEVQATDAAGNASALRRINVRRR